MGQKMDDFIVDLNSCKEICYDMSDYGNGLYYFVLKNKGQKQTQKVALIR